MLETAKIFQILLLFLVYVSHEGDKRFLLRLRRKNCHETRKILKIRLLSSSLHSVSLDNHFSNLHPSSVSSLRSILLTESPSTTQHFLHISKGKAIDEKIRKLIHLTMLQAQKETAVDVVDFFNRL
jgi:hypothetical protein